MKGALSTAPVAALSLLVFSAAPAHALSPVPGLSGPVVDQAGLLGPGDVERLGALSRAARAQGGGSGVELQYLIVPSLGGESLEDFSMRVAEAWQLGSKGKDNGVLVTVSRDDRAVRIEVGGGLEGGLTDAQSSRIIRETIAPAFRQGRYGDGLYDAGVQVLGALGALPRQVARAPKGGRGVHLSSVAIALLVVFILLVRIASGFSFRRRSSLWGLTMGGGGYGGGRFGGGGGGGSGWSGGGGGFSGGGASGGW